MNDVDSVKNGLEDESGDVWPLELLEDPSLLLNVELEPYLGARTICPPFSFLAREKLKMNIQGKPLKRKEVTKKQQHALYVEGEDNLPLSC